MVEVTELVGLVIDLIEGFWDRMRERNACFARRKCAILPGIAIFFLEVIVVHETTTIDENLLLFIEEIQRARTRMHKTRTESVDVEDIEWIVCDAREVTPKVDFTWRMRTTILRLSHPKIRTIKNR